MRLWLVGLCVYLISFSALSETALGPVLNKITLQLSAEQWVTTKTALVTVGVNAAVSDAGIEKIQEEVLQKLKGISDQGDWHITSYQRSPTPSGLESLQLSAQARLPSNALANLRDKAKNLSKSGETFTIDDIQFIPSMSEMRDTNISLRNDIYQQVKEEIARIAKLYPEQKYFVHEVNFINNISPGPVPQNAMLMQMRGAGAAAPSGLGVGDKLVLTATVTLAATPDQPSIRNLRI